jgi:hypothetical protein
MPVGYQSHLVAHRVGGARRSAGKSIRLPAWRACPREFPESSNFSNYAHPVYLSWPRWSHPFCGLQSEAHEGDNRNSASFPALRRLW